VPAEQRLRSATVDSNCRLQREQCADSSCRVRAALEGASDSEQCLSGAAPDCPVPPRCQSSNGRNRQNPNDWVTWLAHRTVSGGALDCSVHPSTDSLPNGWFGGWGYKYPQPPPLQASKFFRLHIQYKS
jgi:hypothetical protein